MPSGATSKHLAPIWEATAGCAILSVAAVFLNLLGVMELPTLTPELTTSDIGQDFQAGSRQVGS